MPQKLRLPSFLIPPFIAAKMLLAHGVDLHYSEFGRVWIRLSLGGRA